MNRKQVSLTQKISLTCLLTGSISLAELPAVASEVQALSSSKIAQLSSRDRSEALDRASSLSEITQPQTSDFSSMTQVTSVSQLSDVKPTDWAFQALQSLVERYGCIAGYPDKTYRGNRALTRYEFAAGLNACLDRVNELIAAATADLVKKEDLATLQKLQEEFAAELSTLRGRVDALEARTTTLEKQQFSTTTKLSGEAIFSLASGYGGAPTGRDANPVFNNRVRLNLKTSFSGKDLLITGLQAYNFGGGGDNNLLGRSGGGSIAGQLGLGDAIFGNASNARLSYEPQFPTVNPQDLSPKGGSNSVNVYKLLYIFPVASKLTAFAGTNAEVSDAFPAILPFSSEGQGAVSRFSALPAAQRVSGGTSQTGLASAAGVILNLSDAIDFRALYGSVNANIVSNQAFPGTPLGAGVFNGSYIAAAQLTVKPSPAIDIGLNYAHSYHQINLLGTGLSSSDFGAIAFNPTAAQIISRGAGLGAAGAVVNQGIKMDTLGASVAFRLAPTLTLAGSYTHIFSNLVDVNASTNFNSWLVGLHIQDILKKGNSAGVIFGQPLKRVSTGGVAINPENRTPYQVEGYFNFRMNDNISITPGVFVIFNPEGFKQNDTVFMPVIRTTFTF